MRWAFAIVGPIWLLWMIRMWRILRRQDDDDDEAEEAEQRRRALGAVTTLDQFRQLNRNARKRG